MRASIKDRLAENWLTLLIALQPLLDVLAFWTANETATIAGYIRLLILLALPLWLLLHLKEKKRFVLSMAVIGLYCLLHVLNGFRVGYLNLAFDVSYMLRVVQMPVLAICFVFLIREEQTKRQAYRGIAAATFFTLLFLLLAFVTGTGNTTYPEGFGFSGWVISDNRCAQSIILVSLAVFCEYFSLQSRHKWLVVVTPALITLVFLTNGTKACYYALFAIFFAFAAVLVLEKPILGKKVRWLAVCSLVLLMGFSVVIYPYTPRAKVSAHISQSAKPGEIEEALLEKGIDISDMSLEERFNDPVVKEVFTHYYIKYIGVQPDLYERFGMDRVLLHYRMTTDVAKLIDQRVMKLAYADMIWEDTDFLTKLVGYEVTEIGTNGDYDMENDWPAIFYYYGYLGCALYVGFVLYFLLLVFRRLVKDFKGSFTEENVALLLCLLLQLGLAQFSGAILRRPNVSIYLALVLALIYFQTVRLPERGGAALEA